MSHFSFFMVLFMSLISIAPAALAQDLKAEQALDAQVKNFLNDRSHQWHDMNIPATDGQTLYDLIIKNKYTRALEIGTSTGHSAIWIAWALSKTGGKLITIEIDKDRHQQALANFKQAGLADYIDARQADAHELVKTLEGPFDFVFSDADKEWYTEYFKAVAPKLTAGGCYTAHNVSSHGWGGSQEFYKYVTGLPDFTTTINSSGGGISISYKKAAK